MMLRDVLFKLWAVEKKTGLIWRFFLQFLLRLQTDIIEERLLQILHSEPVQVLHFFAIAKNYEQCQKGLGRMFEWIKTVWGLQTSDHWSADRVSKNVEFGRAVLKYDN